MSFKQPDIDLMFWQYCMGLLDAGNAFTVKDETALKIVNMLSHSRFYHLKGQFDIAPSFRVVFENQQTHFSITKTSL